jgi:hypothetical protein
VAFDKGGLDDYNTVAERISEFKARYPDGYLSPLNQDEPFRVLFIGDKVFIVVAAAAYRDPGDACPGVGMAWEPFPGRTPYTRDSELMNAETSAWGRALIALGAADSRKGIASREEVRNRQEDDGASRGSDWRPPASPSTRKADRHNASRRGPLPDDQWTTEPRDETVTGTSLPDQQRAIAMTLTRKGITTREGKLAFCSQVTSRPVASSGELSYLEAEAVLRQAEALPATPAGQLAQATTERK